MFVLGEGSWWCAPACCVCCLYVFLVCVSLCLCGRAVCELGGQHGVFCEVHA